MCVGGETLVPGCRRGVCPRSRHLDPLLVAVTGFLVVTGAILTRHG